MWDLGNIYVDEALFTAGIHPERPADSLTPAEWAKLFDAVRATLGRAVEAGGSSIKSYVNGQGEMGMFQHELLVYGRKNEPCSQCGRAIEKADRWRTRHTYLYSLSAVIQKT